MLAPFEPWHLEMMRLAPSVQEILGKYPAPETLGRLAAAGLVYTLLADDGSVLGVAGLVPVDGAGEVFVVAAEERHGHRVEFAKSVRRILDHAKRHFAKIDALAGPGSSARWFEWLGFVPAGEPGRWTLRGVG